MKRVFSLWHFAGLGQWGSLAGSSDRGDILSLLLRVWHDQQVFVITCQSSHPGLDLTHGDVVHGGLLPPGALGHHHLQHQQYIPAGRHPRHFVIGFMMNFSPGITFDTGNRYK